MQDLQDSPKIRKRVFNVLVECLQNLYHHIDEFEIVGSPEELAEKKSAIFSISRTPESYDSIRHLSVSEFYLHVAQLAR